MFFVDWQLAGSCFWLTLCASLFLIGCAPTPVQVTQAAQPEASPTPVVLPTQPSLPTSTAQPVGTDPQSSAPPIAIDGPLSVVIESPAEDAVVKQSPLEISGQADPDTVITINDTIILVEKDRRFSVNVDLVEGINIIEIVASDLDENQEVFFLTVDYELSP